LTTLSVEWAQTTSVLTCLIEHETKGFSS